MKRPKRPETDELPPNYAAAMLDATGRITRDYVSFLIADDVMRRRVHKGFGGELSGERVKVRSKRERVRLLQTWGRVTFHRHDEIADALDELLASPTLPV